MTGNSPSEQEVLTVTSNGDRVGSPSKEIPMTAYELYVEACQEIEQEPMSVADYEAFTEEMDRPKEDFEFLGEQAR